MATGSLFILPLPRGGRRLTNRARRERKGTPQGSPISPLFSNVYMRRFILGWKVLGYARRFKAEIVNYADDLAVLGRAPAAEMLTAVDGLMRRLKLPMNAEKTRCCRMPEEPMTFLGYRIGRNYRPFTGAAYIGTRPSRESVQSICRRVSELTTRRDALLPLGEVVARLNRLLTGWANYLPSGRSAPRIAPLTSTPRGGCASGSTASTRCETGNRCASRTSDSGRSTGSRALPRERRAFRGRRHDLVRKPDAGNPHVRFDERRLETEPRRGVRHRHLAKAAGNSYPLPPTATAPVVDSTRYPALRQSGKHRRTASRSSPGALPAQGTIDRCWPSTTPASGWPAPTSIPVSPNGYGLRATCYVCYVGAALADPAPNVVGYIVVYCLPAFM